MDDRFGALTFIRVYSGQMKKGDTILNSATGKTERQCTPTIVPRSKWHKQAIFLPYRHEECSDSPLRCLCCDLPRPRDLNRGGSQGQGHRTHGKMIASFRVETDEDSGETILPCTSISRSIFCVEPTVLSSTSRRWPTEKPLLRSGLVIVWDDQKHPAMASSRVGEGVLSAYADNHCSFPGVGEIELYDGGFHAVDSSALSN